MAKKATLKDGRLSTFRPLQANPNQHTQRGLGMLQQSVQEDGWVAPITVAADGESLDGDARMEVAADKFGDDVIVVEHDGTKPIVMVRTDIPNAGAPIARRIAYRANRVGETDLSWDAAQIAADLEGGLDLSDMFRGDELAKLLEKAADGLLGENDPAAEWQGMPEFKQEDAFGYQRLIVHFSSKEDVVAFANLVQQTITSDTRFIWYPEQKPLPLAEYRVDDES